MIDVCGREDASGNANMYLPDGKNSYAAKSRRPRKTKEVLDGADEICTKQAFQDTESLVDDKSQETGISWGDVSRIDSWHKMSTTDPNFASNQKGNTWKTKRMCITVVDMAKLQKQKGKEAVERQNRAVLGLFILT